MNGRVDLHPITKESYIAFTKNISDSLVSFRFIDSFKFMNSSLDKLSSYLTEYPILKSEFLQYTEEHIRLLTKKSVYSYDFTDSFDKFSYPHLPSQVESEQGSKDLNREDWTKEERWDGSLVLPQLPLTRPVIDNGKRNPTAVEIVPKLGYLHVYSCGPNVTCEELLNGLKTSAWKINFHCELWNRTEKGSSFKVSFPIEYCKEVYMIQRSGPGVLPFSDSFLRGQGPSS
nr:unnamed protein product [Callosobruchus analis]